MISWHMVHKEASFLQINLTRQKYITKNAKVIYHNTITFKSGGTISLKPLSFTVQHFGTLTGTTYVLMLLFFFLIMSV